MFSLARGGYAPRLLGEVSSRGTPLPRALGLGSWIGAGNMVGFCLSRWRVRLFVRNRHYSADCSLVDDLCDAFVLPLEMGLGGPASPAGAYDRLSVHFARGGCGDHRNPRNDVVGGRHARNADRGAALAGSGHDGIFSGPPTPLARQFLTQKHFLASTTANTASGTYKVM